MSAPDKFDLKLLVKLAADGPSFMKSASHEMRACNLRRDGYLTGEMTCYSMTGGGASMNLRNRYTITDKGRALLSGMPSSKVPS